MSEENCSLRESIVERDKEVEQLNKAKKADETKSAQKANCECDTPMQKILRKESVELHYEKEQLKIERDRLRHTLKEKQVTCFFSSKLCKIYTIRFFQCHYFSMEHGNSKRPIRNVPKEISELFFFCLIIYVIKEMVNRKSSKKLLFFIVCLLLLLLSLLLLSLLVLQLLWFSLLMSSQ